MNFIDLIVLGAILVFALAGWRQGFVAAFMSFFGFLAGGFIGAIAGPMLVDRFELVGTSALLVTGGTILICAVIGQILMSYIGRSLRAMIPGQPIKLLDNIGGVLLNTAAILVFGLILLTAANAMPTSSVSSAVKNSSVLSAIDNAIPAPARSLMDGASNAFVESGLPSIFDGLGFFVPALSEPPSPAVVKNPEVQKSLNSVVRVAGDSPNCQHGLTGSGFVFAPGRVMTNAHVVAGVPNPRVYVPNVRSSLSSRVVYFDPKVDVAVLVVEGLEATPLGTTNNARRGESAVIAGYPGGKDMTATASRVRGVVESRTSEGTDIFGNQGISREILVLDGTARPGSSGGPVINERGRVNGLIFAQAQGDGDTAFALTMNQVSRALQVGQNAFTTVENDGCPVSQ